MDGQNTATGTDNASNVATEALAATTIVGAETDTAVDPEVESPVPEKSANEKKLENALSRQKKRANKYRAENREIKRQQAEFEQKRQSSPASKEPNPDDYNSYGDYLKARQDWTFESHTKKQEDAKTETEFTGKKQTIQAEQARLFVEERDAFVSTTPDAAEVFKSCKAELDALPQDIVDMIFDLDNPVAALYTLAKEGRLENIAHMGPMVAAAELVAAQSRGAQTVNRVSEVSEDTPQNSQAPRPMAPAKGAGTSTSKSLDTMSARDLVKWAKKT